MDYWVNSEGKGAAKEKGGKDVPRAPVAKTMAELPTPRER